MKALYVYERKRFLLILHYKILKFTNEHPEGIKKNKRKKLAQLMQMFLKGLVKAIVLTVKLSTPIGIR